MPLLHILVLVLYFIGVGLAIVYRELSPVFFVVLAAVTLYVFSAIHVSW